MAVEREAHVNRSRDIGLVWVVLIFGFGLLMGLVAAPALLDKGIALPDAEKLYLVVAETFFHPVIAGLLLTRRNCGGDEHRRLPAAAGLGHRHRRYAPSSSRITYSMQTHARVWLGRGMLVLVGIVAAVISIVSPESVFALVSLAWGGMGAAFGPVVILALYWRRFNLWGALAAVVSGTVVSTWWWLAGLGYERYSTVADLLGFEATVDLMEEIGVWQVNPAVPGFLAALLFAWVVTRLTAPPPAQVSELFDRVNAPEWTEPAPPGRGLTLMLRQR